MLQAEGGDVLDVEASLFECFVIDGQQFYFLLDQTLSGRLTNEAVVALQDDADLVGVRLAANKLRVYGLVRGFEITRGCANRPACL